MSKTKEMITMLITKNFINQLSKGRFAKEFKKSTMIALSIVFVFATILYALPSPLGALR
jgi:hypothetical protein